jgi:hypothetical protein
MMTPTNDNDVEKFVEEDLARYEQYLIPGCLYDAKIFQACDKALNKDSDGKDITDFIDPLNTVLFKAIQVYHATTNYSMTPDFVVFQGILERFTLQEAGRHALTSDMVMPLLHQLRERCIRFAEGYKVWQPILLQGFLTWISARRFAAMLQRKRTLNWTSSAFSDSWTKESTHLRMLLNSGDNNRWESVWDCVNVTPEPIFLTSPWPHLNDAMGGGFARGDATMFVSHTGGGKTVAACQLAGHFAMQHQACGIFISTEMQGAMILPRLISCFGHVPYNRMSPDRALALGNLDALHRKNAREVLERLYAVNFYFHRWTPGDPIRQGFMGAVSDYVNTLCEQKRIDYIILDWLGGRLTHGTEGEEERNRMQAAADMISTLADDLNIVSVTTAQGNQAAQGKSQVGSAHLAECKSSHRYYENLVGISNIPDNPTTDELNDPGYARRNRFQDVQYFNVEKCRWGPGGLVRVHRRFEYQRFDSA